MRRFSIVNITNPIWTDLVAKSKQYDFCHTRSYHQLDKGGTPLLFVICDNACFLAMPLILRTIAGTNLKDCTSAYGYCGPLSNCEFRDLPKEMFVQFRCELQQFFRRENIITVFSRLHPIIMADEVFTGFGIIRRVNKTVAIDLTLPVAEQKRRYRKSNKSEINQMRKEKKFVIKEATSEDEIRDFVNIYHDTMKRVNASRGYFFEYDYIYNLLNNSCFKSKLLLAMTEGRAVAGAVFTIAGRIMQYHLAGTADEYIREGPMKLIIDEARMIGNAIGLEYLHLGGSVGDKDDDSLFLFKSGFSDIRFQSRVWQYIVDEEKYRDLNTLFKGSSDQSSNYFPIYRSRVTTI
jgi:hypothetical protein